MIKIPELDTYFGGKGDTGTYQAIINEIPPHILKIIPFMGNCAITRHIKNCKVGTIGFELNNEVCEAWNNFCYDENIRVNNENGLIWLEINAPRFLKNINSHAYKDIKHKDIFIYCDPPYRISSRKDTRKRYEFELTDVDHERFLNAVLQLPFNIAISHYPDEMYFDKLNKWRKVKYKSVTRGGGLADEILFTNYKKPKELHDYSFLGKDFRERERIKNKVNRHVLRLKKLPVLERNAILSAISENGLIK